MRLNFVLAVMICYLCFFYRLYGFLKLISIFQVSIFISLYIGLFPPHHESDRHPHLSHPSTETNTCTPAHTIGTLDSSLQVLFFQMSLSI